MTSDRVSTYIGVRGFGPPGDYNSRILLLLDGHRLSDPVSGGTTFSTDLPVDIDLIERVEVIRGPNSPVYIASALLGVVNVVTKRAGEVDGLTVSGEAGSLGTYKSSVTFGHRFGNGLEMVLSSSYDSSAGPPRLYYGAFDSPATNFGIARDADSAHASRNFASLSYRGFTLEAAYSAWNQGDLTASYQAIFNDSAERVRLSPGFLDLGYEHHFGSDWGYTCRLFYDNDRYHGTYPLDYTPYGGSSRVLNQDYSGGQDVGGSFALSKNLPGGQKLIVGSEYRNNFQQNQWNCDSEPYTRYMTSRLRSDLWGVHVQDEIPLWPDLVLNLGLSYDRYSTFGGTTNPRAALIYQPTEDTSIKFLYGQSFRAPTAFELYYSVTGQNANPDLRPERAKTMEVVVEQSLAGGFRLVGSGYYYPVRDLIGAVTDPATGILAYENSQRVDLRGVEIAVKRQSRSGLEAGFSVSLQDARDLAGPTRPVNSPRMLNQASLSVPLLRGRVFGSMNLQYVSRRITPSGGEAGAYVVPNLTLASRRTAGRWDISASVYNFADQRYDDPASVAHTQDVIDQDGRLFRVKFTYRF